MGQTSRYVRAAGGEDSWLHAIFPSFLSLRADGGWIQVGAASGQHSSSHCASQRSPELLIIQPCHWHTLSHPLWGTGKRRMGGGALTTSGVFTVSNVSSSFLGKKWQTFTQREKTVVSEVVNLCSLYLDTCIFEILRGAVLPWCVGICRHSSINVSGNWVHRSYYIMMRISGNKSFNMHVTFTG